MGVEGPHRGGGFVARELTVRFGGITALDAVSLQAGAGEVLGVIGPNGAGKTTLFNVICGFVQPTSGTLEWRGRAFAKVHTNRLAALGIARTLQGVGLFEGLSVLENVMVGAQRFRSAGTLSALLGLPRADRDERALRERALAMLAELGCADVAARAPHTLAYPVQKRVALARALVSEPELLLLDEPAGGLDAQDMRELGERIRALRGSMTVMLVEHRMDLVMSVCDRVVVLDFGKVIAQGDPASVGSDERVLEAYLGQGTATAPGAQAVAGARAHGAGDAEREQAGR
ncbi:MAG TPA: ABC transporter ATP-binding protein [Solirubrobacteraceae bacterium]|nr:ABC transporter ATP-binding protein [Solirubrobacteraceae bacterium]